MTYQQENRSNLVLLHNQIGAYLMYAEVHVTVHWLRVSPFFFSHPILSSRRSYKYLLQLQMDNQVRYLEPNMHRDLNVFVNLFQILPEIENGLCPGPLVWKKNEL